MASLIDRIKRFMRSPQGQKARARAERLARDPRTQAKARGLLARVRGGRGTDAHDGPPHTGTGRPARACCVLDVTATRLQ